MSSGMQTSIEYQLWKILLVISSSPCPWRKKRKEGPTNAAGSRQSKGIVICWKNAQLLWEHLPWLWQYANGHFNFVYYLCMKRWSFLCKSDLYDMFLFHLFVHKKVKLWWLMSGLVNLNYHATILKMAIYVRKMIPQVVSLSNSSSYHGFLSFTHTSPL